jgi:hypothetical protein
LDHSRLFQSHVHKNVNETIPGFDFVLAKIIWKEALFHLGLLAMRILNLESPGTIIVKGTGK